MPVASKLTDVRLVNNSLKTMLSEARREYWMMVCMVLVNIPLLYCLNKDWYDALMNTVFGKVVLERSVVLTSDQRIAPFLKDTVLDLILQIASVVALRR